MTLVFPNWRHRDRLNKKPCVDLIGRPTTVLIQEFKNSAVTVTDGQRRQAEWRVITYLCTHIIHTCVIDCQGFDSVV